MTLPRDDVEAAGRTGCLTVQDGGSGVVTLALEKHLVCNASRKRPVVVRWSHASPAYMGPMPTSSVFKAVARPSGGDARGVAGAVHADALQQWRQTAP